MCVKKEKKSKWEMIDFFILKNRRNLTLFDGRLWKNPIGGAENYPIWPILCLSKPFFPPVAPATDRFAYFFLLREATIVAFFAGSSNHIECLCGSNFS